MAKQTLNNGESAQIFRTKLNSNFDELYTNQVPANHASSLTTYGVASGSDFGHIKITAGNGLTITGGVLTLGLGTTSVAGALQLVNNLTTNDATKALTAAQGKILKDSAVVTYYGTGTPSAGTGKDGDIYFKIV